MASSVLLLPLLALLNTSVSNTKDLNKPANLCHNIPLSADRSSKWVKAHCKVKQIRVEKEAVIRDRTKLLAANINKQPTLIPPTIVLEKIIFQTDNNTIIKCIFGSDKKAQSCNVLT